MIVLVLALLIGIIAGLRAMTAPAAVSWAAHVGWLALSGTPLAWLGNTWTPWIITALAIGELITDQLPSTPSRTVPIAFGTRILSGGLCGAAIGATSGSLAIGGVIGAMGAIIGTLGGRAARGALAAKFGRDRPAAIIEDIVAIVGAFVIVWSLQ
ncbi:MAG TPA: DUF4126 family protein [Steroidobacteraceae bacterium]|nr:DUF4126 family protein [Steroidobacteraceae bacterium]